MSTANLYGIFANHISGTVNTGINAVRGFDKAKCARVYRACVALLPADEVAWRRESFATAYNGGTSMLDQTIALTGCTPAQAWCSTMLSAVQSHLAARHLVQGSESTNVIHDERRADAALVACLAA